MSTSRYDIRPHLVALYYGDDQSGLHEVLRYGTSYMGAWTRRRQIRTTDEVVRSAVAHGLLRLWRPRQAGSISQRAKQRRMRASSFRLLSDAARNVYAQRLTEGALAFCEVAAHSEDPLAAGTVLSAQLESAWWNKREAGLRNSVKLLEWEVGSSSRPPAIEQSRAPSREPGWLPNFDRCD